MRTINDHKCNGAADGLTINVLDEPGSGGANHHYVIEGFDLKKNKSFTGPFDTTCVTHSTATHIYFQNGAIPDKGLNGLTQEALLAIIIDRLEKFQSGPYPSVEGSEALAHARKSLSWMHKRTEDRIKRQVEGQETK